MWFHGMCSTYNTHKQLCYSSSNEILKLEILINLNADSWIMWKQLLSDIWMFSGFIYVFNNEYHFSTKQDHINELEGTWFWWTK